MNKQEGHIRLETKANQLDGGEWREGIRQMIICRLIDLLAGVVLLSVGGGGGGGGSGGAACPASRQLEDRQHIKTTTLASESERIIIVDQTG